MRAITMWKRALLGYDEASLAKLHRERVLSIRQRMALMPRVSTLRVGRRESTGRIAVTGGWRLLNWPMKTECLPTLSMMQGLLQGAIGEPIARIWPTFVTRRDLTSHLSTT